MEAMFNAEEEMKRDEADMLINCRCLTVSVQIFLIRKHCVALLKVKKNSVLYF